MNIKWVSSEWLGDHLNNEISIIDSQPHFMDYIEDHIPESIYLSEKLFRSYHINRPCVHVPPEGIEKILRRSGIKKDIPTIIYTGKGSHGDKGSGLIPT